MAKLEQELIGAGEKRQKKNYLPQIIKTGKIGVKHTFEKNIDLIY